MTEYVFDEAILEEAKKEPVKEIPKPEEKTIIHPQIILKTQEYIEKHKNPIMWITLIIFTMGGFFLRISNAQKLKNTILNEYVPTSPDPIGILRYMEYVVEHGSIMQIDYLRYYPFGFANLEEFALLSHILANFYKMLHFFNSEITVSYANVVYPAFAFVCILFIFFLIVKKTFNWKIALLASVSLTVIPSFFIRTSAGVSDKEPLALIFMFLTAYLFLLFLTEKKDWKSILYMTLCSISVSILFLLWGGYLFIFITITTYILLLVLLEKIERKKLFLSGMILLFPYSTAYFYYSDRLGSLLYGPATAIFLTACILSIIHLILYQKYAKKIQSKINLPFFLEGSLFLLGAGIFFLIFKIGINNFPSKILELSWQLTHPLTSNIFVSTVAENASIYFIDYILLFSPYYFIIMSLGLIILFFSFLPKGNKQRIPLLITSSISLGAFFFQRYASDSILNGDTILSLIFFLSSISICTLSISYFMYKQYKQDKEQYYTSIKEISTEKLFLVMFFIILLFTAYGTLRFIFLFIAISTIFFAYGCMSIYSFICKIKTRDLQYALLILFTIAIIYLLSVYYISDKKNIEEQTIPITPQWSNALEWIKTNTNEQAVFAQWWDYGYYIQTYGERATLSDGGNADSTINHLIARYLFTTESEEEAIQFMASRNVTHVIVYSEDLGKYSEAISLIGSNEEYDRLIQDLIFFQRDDKVSTKTEQGYNLTYFASVGLEEDIFIDEKYFPKGYTTLESIKISITLSTNQSISKIKQPTGIIAYNTIASEIPIRCIFYEGKEIIFEQGDALEYCIYLTHEYKNGKLEVYTLALPLSPKLWKSWFGQHYILEKESKYFKKVYNDTNGIIIYNGTVSGPITIWEAQVPFNPTMKEELLTSSPRE